MKVWFSKDLTYFVRASASSRSGSDIIHGPWSIGLIMRGCWHYGVFDFFSNWTSCWLYSCQLWLYPRLLHKVLFESFKVLIGVRNAVFRCNKSILVWLRKLDAADWDLRFVSHDVILNLNGSWLFFSKAFSRRCTKGRNLWLNILVLRSVFGLIHSLLWNWSTLLWYRSSCNL